MQKRNVLNSPRLAELKKRRYKVFLNKILFSIFGILILFAGGAYASRISSLNISGVEIIGNKVVEGELVKARVEEVVAGKYLWLFRKTNVLFYPKNTIKKELAHQFKRLKDIEISLGDNKVLKIEVTERMPAYTWCGKTLEDEDRKDHTCFFVDEGGYIFDEAPYFSGEVYFKFYGALEPDFEKLVLFKKTLESMNLKPVALYRKVDEDIIVFLSSPSPTKPQIILSTSALFEKVAENLQAALNTEPLRSNFENKYSSLQYIDLRFGNKVYYKFK